MPFAPERRRPRKATFLALAALATTGAIAIACGIDAIATRDGPIPGGPDTGDDHTVVLPPEGGPPLDATPDVVIDAAEAGCPTGHGTMVLVALDASTYCIDSTEVTNAEYTKFVDATDGGAIDSGAVDGSPPGCSFNTTYGPVPAGNADFPAVYINWCSAYAYCGWAGKRLCSKSVALDASTGEWFGACSKGGTLPFAYGTTHINGACNDGTGSVAATGSHAQCEGGVPGLFDMPGNVDEWTDNCSGTTCAANGGDYGTTNASCSSQSVYAKGAADPAIGFRCCADLQ